MPYGRGGTASRPGRRGQCLALLARDASRWDCRDGSGFPRGGLVSDANLGVQSDGPDDPRPEGGRAPRASRDTRLVKRTIRERWPIPKALRGTLIEKLAGVMADPGVSPRGQLSPPRISAVIRAARVVVVLG